MVCEPTKIKNHCSVSTKVCLVGKKKKRNEKYWHSIILLDCFHLNDIEVTELILKGGDLLIHQYLI